MGPRHLERDFNAAGICGFLFYSPNQLFPDAICIPQGRSTWNATHPTRNRSTLDLTFKIGLRQVRKLRESTFPVCYHVPASRIFSPFSQNEIPPPHFMLNFLGNWDCLPALFRGCIWGSCFLPREWRLNLARPLRNTTPAWDPPMSIQGKCHNGLRRKTLKLRSDGPASWSFSLFLQIGYVSK